MSVKQTMFIEWLNKGVIHGVITETKAKKLFVEKYKAHAKISTEKFLKILYSM